MEVGIVTDDGELFVRKIDVLMHPQALKGDSNWTLFLGGYGEGPDSIALGVERIGEHGIKAIAPVMPYDEPGHLNHVLRRTPLDVVTRYNKEAERDLLTPVPAIGKSLGGGALLLAAADEPRRFSAVALQSPAGLTHEFLGNRLEHRVSEFVHRLTFKNLILPDQNWLMDSSNGAALREGAERAIADQKKEIAEAKLDYVVGLDLRDELQDVVTAGVPVEVFAGRHDPVFQIGEYRRSLRAMGLEGNLTEMSGSHTLIGSYACYLQHAYLALWLRQLNQGRAEAS